MADAFSAIQGLHPMLMVIMSPAIRSRHRNSGGIGEYTRSFPQVGQRIMGRAPSDREMSLFGSNEDYCAFNLDLVDWFWSLGWSSSYFTGCEVESGPVPGTFDYMVFQFSLA